MKARPFRRLRVISGGQTGADRAGLDAALELGIACGGSCPRGRLAEDGAIPARYPVRELSSGEYHVRTGKNVADCSGTLIFTFGPMQGGSLLTAKYCGERGKPCLHLDGELSMVAAAAKETVRFIEEGSQSFLIYTLNVAGQRSSKEPRIYGYTYDVLALALPRLRHIFCF